MPILLPPHLPAYDILKQEGYDARPLTAASRPHRRIALVNLMPVKPTTEHHFARVLSHTLVPVELVLLRLAGHTSKNTPQEHIDRFYTVWESVKEERLDGVIVTGAPVEHLDFADVTYWEELARLFDWLKEKQIPSLFICWGAQAALHHYFDIPKYTLPHKALGLFPHHIRQPSPLLLGFDDEFGVPVARNTEVRSEDIEKHPELAILADSPLSGVYVVQHRERPQFYVFNHLEYTSDTIVEEYFREINQGKPQPVPYNYFPEENPQNTPLNRWRSHATLLYSNWLRECLSHGETQAHPLNLAIAGLGTVGSHVVRLLYQQRELIEQRTGRPVRITAVSAKNRDKERHLPELHGLHWVEDPLQLADLPEVDVIVELIGGSEGVARSLVEKALAQGKHVVTANKALLAHHGVRLIASAEDSGLKLAFEAAVGGGVPMLKTLREALASDSVEKLTAILNGTANYILSQMQATGEDFATVLARAQTLGYAEADPSFDVDGWDTAHKLNILACIAFGQNLLLKDTPVEGIRALTPVDIRAAERLGYRIKLLAEADRQDERLTSSVAPKLVPEAHPLATTSDAFNSIVCHSRFAGELLLRGYGAGGAPTAAAVVADIVDIASGRGGHPFGIPAREVVTVTPHGSERQTRYYLRLPQQPGSAVPFEQAFQLEEAFILLTPPLAGADAAHLRATLLPNSLMLAVAAL